jgi:tRNA 2-selenouridine synthase
MRLQRIGAEQAAASLDGFDAVVDARSESEFAQDHLPGAVNWPTLDDAQRHAVGTEYKQVSAFDARLHGAVFAARNIADHLQREGHRLHRGWRPLVYCWRGGQRSGALALVLAQIGFDVSVLEGGYRAFRRLVIAQLETLPLPLQLMVLCGQTGTGKSRLLAALAGAGEQVVDLEALAGHRGSVLGALAQAQPGQKRFEMQLWDRLRRLDPSRTTWIESESRTIGRLRVPQALLMHMRASGCVDVRMSLQDRIELLLDDYPHLLGDVEGLCSRLDALREVRGAQVVSHWQSMARRRQWRDLVSELLVSHYDPIYQRSMTRNFSRLADARPLQVGNGGAPAIELAAQQLLQSCPADRGTPLPGSVGTA